MKKLQTILLCPILLGLLFLSISAQAIDPDNTRLLQNPAVSTNHIAFIYAEDLWIADKDDSNPRRLTIDEGVESNPVFSPDGQYIAFSAQYDGNTDVFVVPATGGVPKRLTYHPSVDIVRDFTPDGKNVLFASRRTSISGWAFQLLTVSIEGGAIDMLPIPYAFDASFDAEATHIAYTIFPEVFLQWKDYRGGTQSKIWLYDRSTHEVVEIPKPESGSNDTNPQWLNGTVYFRSDRNGEFNIYAYQVSDKKITQLTNFEDFPVLNISAINGEIVFEQGGYLHRLNLSNNEISPIKIGIATDLLELRTRYVSGKEYIRSGSVSPSGARAVFDFRGDILTAPAKKGDIKYITATPGIHEKFPVWSPDGKTIAYFSDESGEYALHIREKEGLESPRKIKLNGTGFYANLHWSPDGKKLAFVDNGRHLYVLDVASGNITTIAQDDVYFPGPFRELFGGWSHDNQWITYTKIIDTNFEQAFIYSVKNNKSYPLSDGLSNVSSPIFDPSGKYIYMLASTDAGPVVNWFDQSNQDMEMTSAIYLVTLQKETPSPLAKENDEETPKKEDNEKDKKDEKTKDKAPSAVTIDWDGINERIISLPVAPGMYSNLGSAKEGELLYLSRAPHTNNATMHKYDLNKREDSEVMPVDGYEIAAGGEKMLYYKGNMWGISAVGVAGEDQINVDALQVKIDPQAEWSNIFNEAWRVNRDYFYDPGMHGVDWPAMKTKYGTFLSDVSCRSDLYRVMQWMFSELRVGHHRFTSRGDQLAKPEQVPGGLIGADYTINNGRYRFSKIYGGLNWNPGLRSPLTEPGVNVNEGDYLLAVNGRDVTAAANLYSYFENTAEKITSITVGPNPNYDNSRVEKVVPVANEFALRNRDWVEGNLKKVNEATDGRVAYVYVPNTAGAGHDYFKRYFFPQADKEAVIIDERFNGGGQLADYYIDILKRPLQSHWTYRYGRSQKAPNASIQGPKVMLINENAGSGGDYLPWLFRRFDMGTIIGTRTWGGLVGILGYPEFIDGGSVTAPNVAFWSEDGYRVENEGVAPDIEVEQLPKAMIEGHDPQLEKAIEVIMKQLEEHPPKQYQKPDFPNKVKD